MQHSLLAPSWGRSALMFATVSALVLSLSACAGETAVDSNEPAASDPAAVKLLPKEIADSGELRVVTTGTNIPMSYLDSDNKLVGIDPDFAAAIAEKLGLELNIKNAPFDSIIPGLQADRYDVALANMTAMKPRQEILDQVTYLFEPGGFIIPAEDDDITGPSDLCGKTVTALQGSQDLGIVEKFSAECVEAGEKAIDISVFTDKNGAVLAVESGRADANVGARMSHSYAVKNSKDRLKIATYIFQGAPLGITMPKETKLAPAILAAIEAMVADGTYDAILEKHSVQTASLMNCPPVDVAPFCVEPGINNSELG